MKDKHKVLLASAEAVPFAKVGGMADVVGALPIALRKLGIDARVILPGYGFIEHLKYDISLLFTFEFHHRQGASTVNVYTCLYEDVPFYFVQVFPYFGDDATVYTEWTWDVPRFIFFNQVVMGAIWQLHEKLNWFPDVVHANDWHTGLLPFLIANNHWQLEWAQVATMTTIHNILYQGDHVWKYMWDAGIAPREHPALAYSDLSDNMLAIGLAYSDMITTVSPRYAQEIQHSTYGYGLTNLILSRQADLYGVLNGIDAELWDPATDPYIADNFSADNFETNRPPNKAHLQQSSGLEVNSDIPLIGMVSRLTWQKGIDLAIPALHRILSETDAQFVVLGTGDPSMERDFENLQNAFPFRVRAYLHYNAALAQQIYAGSDMFLMPSHFEPCGDWADVSHAVWYIADCA